MHAQRTILVPLLIAASLYPLVASAKRAAPKPVAPVVHGGVEYRAKDMCYVEAVELPSKKTLWRTRVYYVWYMPLAEKDCQDVFISSLSVQGEKLLVRNEVGRSYRVDLATGRIEGAARYWIPWLCVVAALLLVGFFVWRRF